MTPPICKLCGKDFYHAVDYGQGDLVYFSDYKTLLYGVAGKPQGCDWYCVDHSEAANSKVHLTSDEAYFQLKQEFPNIIMHDWHKRLDPELWVIDIGDNKAKVIMYIRQITDVTPTKLQKKLSNKEFKVLHGWPTQINPHREKLEALGVRTEIRFR